jgi:hypothetical protein
MATNDLHMFLPPNPELPLGIFPARTGILQRDPRIGTDRELALLSGEPIGEVPEARTARGYPELETGPSDSLIVLPSTGCAARIALSVSAIVLASPRIERQGQH